MKVNFDGAFRDIQKLISSPAVSVARKDDFGELLSSISPDKPQLAENTSVNGVQEVRVDLPEEAPKARFNFISADLMSPGPEPLPVPQSVLEQATSVVNEPAVSVKTPTILSARRLPAEDPFSGLNKKERISKVRELAENAGLKHGVDPALSLAVVENESSFNARAISSDGYYSKGLMQLLDTTGKEQLARNGVQGKSYKPFDPGTNVELGVSYLRYLHDVFSQGKALPNNLTATAAANSSSLEKLAVAAYNAGEGRVASAQERAAREGKNPSLYEDIEMYLPESTREYVKRVMADKASYEGEPIG